MQQPRPAPASSPRPPSAAQPVSRQALIGLTIAIVLDTGLQIFWKMAVTDLPNETHFWPVVHSVLHRPIFLLVGCFMAAQAVNWIAVLDHADLSYAHAITSLSYISVGALSFLYLGERLDSVQLFGITLILAGVWCVGKSGAVASHADGNQP